MKGMSECAVLTIALAALAQPVLARTYPATALRCDWRLTCASDHRHRIG
jgi:hypothetical protein